MRPPNPNRRGDVSSLTLSKWLRFSLMLSQGTGWSERPWLLGSEKDNLQVTGLLCGVRTTEIAGSQRHLVKTGATDDCPEFGEVIITCD